MNGMRFGKAGWEIAFGPGIGFKRMSNGFFDTQGVYGETDRYWTEGEFRQWSNNTLDPNTGETIQPIYEVTKNADTRGNQIALNTRWVMAVGRTFRAGGLNIPVNIFYSSMKKSGMIGLSVGFNVVKE